ncbi:hypothetical protein AAP_02356 [Ascosphaera apis ARSEF 7405]|uniref:Uncharacterized protein n=1 Tax=Ascosphaera apis ARSEF 7405 TaxID=392613 RepID=A0A168A7D3_9EURO|nr:hypothetical protein AAP_02356 [Ascosphaera apis ARSEF 7405]
MEEGRDDDDDDVDVDDDIGVGEARDDKGDDDALVDKGGARGSVVNRKPVDIPTTDEMGE